MSVENHRSSLNQRPPWQSRMPSADLDVPSAEDDDDTLVSSGDDDSSPFPAMDLTGPPTDELAQRLVEHEAKQLRKIERLKRRKQQLKSRLAAYKKKEKEFVAQMDCHMDEVERTEHELTQRIEQLTAENQQLRALTEKRARDNAQHVEKLTETTKQCSESETRVQFLVDRIVALLSAGSADPAQTEAVVKMRQREREVLRQLEETRAQFDEVRQQNGELTSRLTEELGLSRRLSDQLAEVEERFFHHRTSDLHPGAGFGQGVAPGGNNQGQNHSNNQVPASMRGGRLGPRPLGLRSDQTETPQVERVERPRDLPELPPPISETEEHCGAAIPLTGVDGEPPLSVLSEHSGSLMPMAGPGSGYPGAAGQRMPLGAVPESEVPFREEEESAVLQEEAAPEGPLGLDAGSRSACSLPGVEDEALETNRSNAFAQMPAPGRLESDAHQNALPDALGQRKSEEDLQPSSSAAREAQDQLPSALLASGQLHSRTLSAEAIALMEQKLREALDNASFECAVVRVDTGIYNFGAVTAMVELAAETMEVVALRSDGTFEPIDDFIRHIAQESRPSPSNLRAAEPITSEDQALATGEATLQSSVSDANVGSQALGQGGAPPENASGGLSTDAARQEQEPRAAVNHHLTAQVAAPKYVPHVNPVANIASAAQWGANPSLGSLGNMAGPGLGVHGAPAPAAHSLGTSGRAGSLTEVGSGARPASQVVAPMQLHASSVPPLLGMPKSASSTPERLRMPIVAGIPSAASLMGQIISPRPHSAQKPAVGPVVSNPHRVLLPTTQTALIMGVTQSPNRQFPVPPGPQPQLHTI